MPVDVEPLLDSDFRSYPSLAAALLGCLKHGLIFYRVMETDPFPKLRVWGLSQVGATLQWQANKKVWLLGTHQLGATERTGQDRVSEYLDSINTSLPFPK